MAARTFLFQERKLHPAVIRWCKLTSWTDRYGTPWLQIPYYDTDGKLIGIQNRRLGKGEGPRFKFPQGSKCNIYNLPILNLLKRREPLDYRRLLGLLGHAEQWQEGHCHPQCHSAKLQGH